MISDQKRYRYERKAFITGLSLHEVKAIVQSHDAFFREIHRERRINNVYFETLDFQSFAQSVDGAEDRTKIRLRWYGDMLGRITDPFLEFKIKASALGRKERFAVPSFDVVAVWSQ